MGSKVLPTISYEKILKITTFIIVLVDVSASAAAFVRTIVYQVSLRRTVIIDVWKLVRHLVLVHRLVLFFSDVYRFPDLLVHPAAFSVDQPGTVPLPVYDVVERDGVVCDCQLVLLCFYGFTVRCFVCKPSHHIV